MGMMVFVHIVERATGRVAFYEEDAGSYGPPMPEEGLRYDYEDGNSSCDCNRTNYFRRALGLPDVESDCGDGAFSVSIFDCLTGRLLYVDGELRT